MTEQLFNEANDAATAAYVGRAGSIPQGFDPTVIIQIITMILEMCKKPSAADVKAACANPSPWHKFQVEHETRRALREKYGWGSYIRCNGDAIIAAVFDVGRSMPDAEVASFCASCCE